VDFMEMALYDEEDGYYTASSRQIGEGGDYATSPEFHPLFGRMLGRQLGQMLSAFPYDVPLTLVEMGAGKGLLSHTTLSLLRKEFRALYERLTLVIAERSPSLREFQHRYLAEFERGGKVIWRESISGGGEGGSSLSCGAGESRDSADDQTGLWTGCLFSNELIDAFPVHRVQMKGGELKEIFVALEGERWVECLNQPSTGELEGYFRRLDIDLAEGVEAEVNLKALDWMRGVGRAMKRGYVVTVDYGYPARELYSPARRQGTLLCYYRHTVQEDPYDRIGCQDMTSHVDFTSLVWAGRSVGLELLGFTDQLSFLMGLGIAQEIEGIVAEKGPDDPEVLRAKALLMPQRMGRVFKVLLQGKKVPKIPMDGFAFRPFFSGVLE
jgi:SAM-dependent MidA family methyltransferase